MAYGEYGFLIPQSTNVVELRDLRYADDGSPVATPEIYLTIYDAHDHPVADESWPKTMTLVAGSSPATYRGTVSDLAAIFNQQNYRIEVNARAPEGSRRIFSDIVTAARSGK